MRVEEAGLGPWTQELACNEHDVVWTKLDLCNALANMPIWLLPFAAAQGWGEAKPQGCHLRLGPCVKIEIQGILPLMVAEDS